MPLDTCLSQDKLYWLNDPSLAQRKQLSRSDCEGLLSEMNRVADLGRQYASRVEKWSNISGHDSAPGLLERANDMFSTGALITGSFGAVDSIWQSLGGGSFFTNAGGPTYTGYFGYAMKGAALIGSFKDGFRIGSGIMEGNAGDVSIGMSSAVLSTGTAYSLSLRGVSTWSGAALKRLGPVGAVASVAGGAYVSYMESADQQINSNYDQMNATLSLGANENLLRSASQKWSSAYSKFKEGGCERFLGGN